MEDKEKIKKMWKRIFNTFEVGDIIETPIGKAEIVKIEGKSASVYFFDRYFGGFTLTLPLKFLKFLETNENEKDKRP